MEKLKIMVPTVYEHITRNEKLRSKTDTNTDTNSRRIIHLARKVHRQASRTQETKITLAGGFYFHVGLAEHSDMKLT